MRPVTTTNVLSILLLLPTLVLSQATNETVFFPNLHFGLLECDNHLTQYGWPDPTHPGTNTHNLIGMFPSGDPRGRSFNASDTYIYTMPQNGVPYHKYEGFNTTAFFWADPVQLPHYPRGWLDIHIPSWAKGMKSQIQAGTVAFEGIELNCMRDDMNLFLGGGTECRASNAEFCAGYTYCQIRYLCRREKWPVDKSCVGSGKNFCYPQWDLPGGE